MLTPDEARQLDLVSFAAALASPALGVAAGRVARARGPGHEFHDFRRYQAGDDLRSIEWTVYARLGQLVTRTYRADAHLRIHLMVDTSRSMGVGTPDKLSCARRISALLAYVATRSGDAVGSATFTGQVQEHVLPATGQPQFFRVLDILDRASPAGLSAIGRALMDYGALQKPPGLVIVISDLFDAAGAFEGLRYLQHRGLVPAVVQVLAPEDLDPAINDDTELFDSEDPSLQPLTIDASALTAYRLAVSDAQTALGEFCLTHGLACVQVRSSDSFTTLVNACRRAGLLTAHA